MKITQIISRTFVACTLALALACVSTNANAQVMKKGKATVRAVHGPCKYSVAGGPWLPIKVNMTLLSGTSVKTEGPESWVDMNVNGVNSTVRVAPNTTMKIDNMEYMGSSSSGDTKTTLNLQSGNVLGNVKKLSASSDYDIRTPNGVAGIRGTDFSVKVEIQPDGNYRITFTSVVGQLVCAAIIPGVPNAVTKVLNDGQSWTPGVGTDVVDEVKDLLKRYQVQIEAAIVAGPPPVTTPTPPPGTPVFLPPNPQNPVSGSQ